MIAFGRPDSLGADATERERENDVSRVRRTRARGRTRTTDSCLPLLFPSIRFPSLQVEGHVQDNAHFGPQAPVQSSERARGGSFHGRAQVRGRGGKSLSRREGDVTRPPIEERRVLTLPPPLDSRFVLVPRRSPLSSRSLPRRAPSSPTMALASTPSRARATSSSSTGRSSG